MAWWYCGAKERSVSVMLTNGNERLLDTLIKLRKNVKMKGLKPEQLDLATEQVSTRS
jgi:hypothetical protein